MINRRAFVLCCAIASASGAFAQTWVSASVGNDANACTRSAPCRTYQRAIYVTPVWSEVHVMDPGEYGPATITQALTIDGGGFGTTLAVSGTAFSITAPATAVVQLRNLAIHGDGASVGIAYNSGAQLVIENVKVNGFSGNCILADPSATGATDLVIKDTSIDNCSSAALYINNGLSLSVEISNTHIHFANFAIYAYTGYITINNSSFSSPGYGSTSYGIYTPSHGNPSVMMDNCVMSGYGYALYLSTGNVQVSRSTFTNNNLVFLSGPISQVISNGNNSFFNNVTVGTISQTVSLQ